MNSYVNIIIQVSLLEQYKILILEVCLTAVFIWL
jgi:hypothetical protein